MTIVFSSARNRGMKATRSSSMVRSTRIDGSCLQSAMVMDVSMKWLRLVCEAERGVGGTYPSMKSR